MGISFVKTGSASQAAAAQAEAEATRRKESIGKLFRFYLSEKEEARITFVDGELDSDGFLVPPRWHEHFIQHNGQWEAFVCPEKTNPEANDSCPLDEIGDRSSLVSGFTIIDHRTYKSKKTDRTYTNTRKLLIAKPISFELLNKYALKRGGLAGCTFDVSRMTKNDAAIGNVFDFVEKRSIEELQNLYMQDETDPKTNVVTKVSYFFPADYENEIVYRTGDELRKLGFGKSGITQSSPGGSAGVVDYSKHL